MSNQTNTSFPIQEHLDYTLRKFCKAEVYQDEFKYQLSPFHCQGFCVAAEGHILLAIDDSLFPTLPDYPEHDTTLVQQLRDGIATAEEFEAYAIDDLEAVCNECEELNEKANNGYANVLYLAPDAISVNVMRSVILAARLLGASSIFVPSPNQAGQKRFFCMLDFNGCQIAMGIFMPIIPKDKHIHPTPQALTLSDTATIDLDAGMQYRADMEAAEEQARKEREESKQVWRVQVVKTGWIAVEAISAKEAMDLASHHTGSIDEDVFEDSDVDVEAVETYPMDDGDVQDMSESYTNKCQGILTDDGFISWSKYYGEEDEDDEFYQDRTRVSVSFGK